MVKVESLVIALALLAAVPGIALAQNAKPGAEVFAKCAICHEVGETAKILVGPVLNGVVGRKAGSDTGYVYSAANKDSGITWDEATLKEYLRNPRAKLPGTKMLFPGLQDDQDIINVIAYLEQFGPDGKPPASALTSMPSQVPGQTLATEQPAPVPAPPSSPPEATVAASPPEAAPLSLPPPPKPAPPELARAERTRLPPPLAVPSPAPASLTGAQHFRDGADALRSGHAAAADHAFDEAGRYSCDYFDLAAKLFDPNASSIKREFSANGLKALQYYLKARAAPPCRDEAESRIRDLLLWARGDESRTVLRWWNEHR